MVTSRRQASGANSRLQPDGPRSAVRHVDKSRTVANPCFLSPIRLAARQQRKAVFSYYRLSCDSLTGVSTSVSSGRRLILPGTMPISRFTEPIDDFDSARTHLQCLAAKDLEANTVSHANPISAH